MEMKTAFLNGLALFHKFSKQNNANSSFFYQIYYFLLVAICKPEKQETEIVKVIKKLEKSKFFRDKALLPLVYISCNRKYDAQKALNIYTPHYIDQSFPLEKFAWLLGYYLTEEKLSPEYSIIATNLIAQIDTGDQHLFSHELYWIVYQKSKGEIKYEPLLSRLKKVESWEQSLSNILGIFAGTSKTLKNNKFVETNRLVYFVDFDRKFVQPILQSLSASGSWSSGRNIALKRLKERQVDCMTDQDNRIASSIRFESSYYNQNYVLDYNKAIIELAGHPYLFYNDNPDISVELIKAQPEIVIEKKTKGYILRCDIAETEKKVIVQKETNTRYKLIELNDQQLSVIRALNSGNIVVPEKGKEILMKTISHLSGFMTIHSDLNGINENIKTVEADSRIRVQLLPIGNSLKAECYVKPFGSVPPYSKPGKGGKILYATIDGIKSQAIRNPEMELSNAAQLQMALEGITNTDFTDAPVIFEDPFDCLTLLDSLKQQTSIAVLEWPEGERFKIKKQASFNQLNLSVKGKGYWFEMEGDLRVDENVVLTIKQLLELNSKSKGRFIELGDGEFLALTDELKKRLDELGMFTSVEKTGVKINKFAAPAIDELSQSAGSFTADKNWVLFQKKIKKAMDKTILLPTTLQADLRPYQEEGFRWLARLADWEAGACLADDMGLGKTLQALALLLHRGNEGPSLVICPASVVANWGSETQRFAPSLNVHLLKPGNREELFDKLEAFDLLITTYGILQSEEERISKIKWGTVVLDEAHAIKNMQSKTSKSAMNINAGFRLILTGTPIQNHLGELWNLFNFTNPGLLGTWSQFNDRYIAPVIKYGGLVEKQHLKKLISPFILRRTKSNVLDELPPKTEITHKVELSEGEMAFYEALRRQAIEIIENSEDPSGAQHLKALAEITKLRLACCHPSLVNSALNLPSSKLESFFEIVDELLENKHRALVFSQFLGHLNIVRQELDKRKINYQYLDGSTPINSRANIVKDFQSGKGDLFLISLKAGGLGLNLTAADYVIHLDPWWNPAVEDQASDRAHRIGQNRPVTIYRLVAKDTIEEKILLLHRTKRDLADSLLEGSDQATKFTTEDLLNLLRNV
jgi:SNF2 family DNA or RNA helicase